MSQRFTTTIPPSAIGEELPQVRGCENETHIDGRKGRPPKNAGPNNDNKDEPTSDLSTGQESEWKQQDRDSPSEFVNMRRPSIIHVDERVDV